MKLPLPTQEEKREALRELWIESLAAVFGVTREEAERMDTLARAMNDIESGGSGNPVG